MRTIKVDCVAIASPMPFVYMVIQLSLPIISFRYMPPFFIKHLAYDDPFKAAEAIGMEKVKRVVGNGETLQVKAEYELEALEFTVLVVFLFCLLLLCVAIVFLLK